MWKVTFNNETKRATGFNRDAIEGEFMVELEPSLCGWVYETPERYQYIDGEFTEVPTWTEELVVKEKSVYYEKILSDIDATVISLQKEDFEYNGNKFYADSDYIHKTRTRMASLPDQSVITWKSSDKVEDGLNNVEIDLTKTEFVSFSDALYDRDAGVWYKGNEIKKSLKSLYLTPETTIDDLKNFKVEFFEAVDTTTEETSGAVDTTTEAVSGQ